MHGWRAGVSRGAASLQIFSVFKEKGVHTILAEGGVGSLHPALTPGDIIIPHDYADFSQRKDVSLGDDFLLIMRDPLCPALRGLLIAEAIDLSQKNVSEEGIYAVTEGRHFESRAEIRLFSQWNIDVVGQSLAPEVYLAREIGACYAGIYLIVNYAEGISGDWSHETLQELFYSESISIGKIILNALKKAIQSPRSCTCSTLRKPSLLKKYLR
jgi:5'-methylthioadenosine phosphorylase